jgi:phosphomevalonate kinase
MKTEGIGWGKLYIAGEYAVIHPGHPAIILATQRHIRAIIQESTEFSIENINSKAKIVFNDLNHVDEYWKYAISALKVFYRLMGEMNRLFTPISITIDSDLDSEEGIKLGLGSSGAVVAAIIKGLNQHYQLHLDHLSLYKLCVISQTELQVKGSYGDLAAAVYGGIIRYTRFSEINQSEPITNLIAMDWKGLSISYLEWPFQIHWVVGWTGHPSSTKYKVDYISKYESDVSYIELLKQAKEIVDDIVDCHSIEIFLEGIQRYRNWLKRLEEITHIEIETPLINDFIDVCSRNFGVAKSSGAGGGDCVVAFFPHPVAISDILLSIGIMPLTITIAKREVV